MFEWGSFTSCLIICNSRFLNLLSWSTFLMATISPVSTTAAWNTTPKDPFPIMRSAEYDIVCSWDKAAEEDVDWGDATLADVEVASLEEVASGGCVDEVFVMDGDICDFCFVLLLIWSIALFLVVNTVTGWWWQRLSLWISITWNAKAVPNVTNLRKKQTGLQ